MYAAWNEWGDLIADAPSYDELIAIIEFLGYYENEVIIGRV